DEPALRVVIPAAGDDLRVGRLARVVDVRRDLAERLLVDDRAHEVPEITRVADLALGQHPGHALTYVVPHRGGHVDARGRTALLALVLEGAAHDRDGQRLRIRALVREDEVL